MRYFYDFIYGIKSLVWGFRILHVSIHATWDNVWSQSHENAVKMLAWMKEERNRSSLKQQDGLVHQTVRYLESTQLIFLFSDVSDAGQCIQNRFHKTSQIKLCGARGAFCEAGSRREHLTPQSEQKLQAIRCTQCLWLVDTWSVYEVALYRFQRWLADAMDSLRRTLCS